jgi:hypothetical protein
MEQAVIAGVVEHGHEDFAIVLEPNEDGDSARADAGAGARSTATAGSSPAGPGAAGASSEAPVRPPA